MLRAQVAAPRVLDGKRPTLPFLALWRAQRQEGEKRGDSIVDMFQLRGHSLDWESSPPATPCHAPLPQAAPAKAPVDQALPGALGQPSFLRQGANRTAVVRLLVWGIHLPLKLPPTLTSRLGSVGAMPSQDHGPTSGGKEYHRRLTQCLVPVLQQYYGLPAWGWISWSSLPLRATLLAKPTTYNSPPMRRVRGIRARRSSR